MASLRLIVVVAIIALVLAPATTIEPVSICLAILDDDDADNSDERLLGVSAPLIPEAPTSRNLIALGAMLVLTETARPGLDPVSDDSPPRLLAGDLSTGDSGQVTRIQSPSINTLPLRC